LYKNESENKDLYMERNLNICMELLQTDADIICLQETKAHPEQLPQEVTTPAGFFSYFDHSKVKKGFIVLDRPCVYTTSMSRFCGAYKDVNHDRSKEFLITFTIRL
jgi:exonuclease III